MGEGEEGMIFRHDDSLHGADDSAAEGAVVRRKRQRMGVQA